MDPLEGLAAQRPVLRQLPCPPPMAHHPRPTRPTAEPPRSHGLVPSNPGQSRDHELTRQRDGQQLSPLSSFSVCLKSQKKKSTGGARPPPQLHSSAPGRGCSRGTNQHLVSLCNYPSATHRPHLGDPGHWGAACSPCALETCVWLTPDPVRCDMGPTPPKSQLGLP